MGGEISVLVVDEDPELLGLTETFLERNHDGITVYTETDTATALERVRDEGIDCVVSDFRMPGMDGIELYEELTAHRPELPFFLFTAADREIESAAQEAGITGYVQKGSGTDHYDELADAIVAAVDR
jgi:CheY-like chemotaxis protein